MKNFRGSALAAGVGTPESAPHELLGSSLRFYFDFKHRNLFVTDGSFALGNMSGEYAAGSFLFL